MVHGSHSKMSILLQLGGGKSESLLQRQFSNGPDTMESALGRDDDMYHPPPQTTYASCFGLPYQDHNYGAPPPPTPPASPPPQMVPKVNGHIEVDDVGSTAVVTTSEPEPVVPEPQPEPVDDSITRCICGFQHDDGYMICCDKCGVWQHVDCMFTDRGAIPDVYYCELCQHRAVDKHRAILLQTAKREELSVTSSTESETETKQAASKKFKKGKKVKLVLGQQNKKPVDSLKKKKVLKKVKKDPLGTQPQSKTNSKKVQKKRENVARKAVAKALKGGGGNQRWRNFQIYRGTRSNSQNLVNGPGGNGNGYPLLDHSYEEATSNVYSPNMQAILANRKTNGSHNSSGDMSSRELLGQLCTVAQVSPSTKGLEASEDLSSNRAIIEFRGKVMLREQFDTEYQDAPCQFHPYTLFYKGFDNLDLCVDASIYGNDARFIRRSCTANAEVRHVVENGQVLFFIYSTKSIPRGAEVTVPFDFSYQNSATVIECPCARASCPVAKAMKKMQQADDKSKVLKNNKKRTNRPKSMDHPSPEKNASSTSAPVSRRRKSSPARTPAPTSDHEMAEEPHIEVQSPKKEPLSSPPAGSGSETRPESEEEAAEKRKKMTREERKMEAIMRAFEKLEKREERRKEALARMPKKSKEEPEVTSPPASKAKVETVEKMEKEPPAAPAAPAPAPPEEAPQEELSVSEVKEEAAPAPLPAPVPAEVKPEKPKPTKGKKRKGHGTPARRRSRYNSSSSGVETLASLSAEDSMPATPASSVPATPVSEGNSAMSPMGFRFPKTKKQMMNEWLSETGQEVAKPLSIKTEPLDDSNNSGEEIADYVKTIPSPRSSLEHLRRNSLSGSREHHSGGSGPKGIGSAKKRWLRQAMVESGTQSSPSGSMSPLYNDATSPNPHAMLHSPGASSAADFVTPLKKRRLARESLSSEGPCPATPSTPLGSGLPISGSPDHEDSSMQSLGGEPTVSPGMEEAALKLKNGFRPHFSPLAPSTSTDTLFERLKQPLAEMETQPAESAATSAELNSSSSSQMNDSAMSCEDLLDSNSGGRQETSPSRTACDSTVPGDRDSLNSTSSGTQETGSSSPLQLVTSQADSPQRPGSTPADSLQGAGLGSSQVDSLQPLASSNDASPPRPVSASVLGTIPEERTESEVSVSNISESVSERKEPVNSSEILGVGSGESPEEDSADTTSAVSAGCSSCQRPSDSPVASCSSDSTGPILPNVDSSENSLGSSPKQVDSSANAGSGVADIVSSDSNINRTVESSVESSDSRVEEAMDTSDSQTASSSVDTSSTDRAQEGALVLCSSSSSTVVHDPATEVSASTDTQPAGPSVSTSNDVDNTELANTTSSGVEGEGVSSQGVNTSGQIMDTVDSAEKLNTSDSAAEISSSKTENKRTDEESELEEGEIIDSSEDEVEKANSNTEQNLPSSSSSSQDLDATRNADAVESAGTADVSGTALSNATRRLTVSDTFSNGEVDSTSSHSTRTQFSGHLSADSSTPQSGLTGPSRTASEVPVVHSCTCPVHPHGIAVNYSGVSDSTVGSSSGNSTASTGQPARPSTPQERTSTPQERKKVSLLEYRQRRRYSTNEREGSRYNSRDSGRSSSSSSPTGSSRSKKNKGPSLAPLPLFDSHSPSRGGKKNGKSCDKWSMSATLAERQREKNSQMSLTERLRKEFGLSDADSDDDREDDDTPPPPPPPRPSDMTSTPQVGRGVVHPGPRMLVPGQLAHPQAPGQQLVARQPVPGMAVGQQLLVRQPGPAGIPPQHHQQAPHSMSHTLATQPTLGHPLTTGGQPSQMAVAPGTPMMVPPPPVPPVSLVGQPQVSTPMTILTQQQVSVAMQGVSAPPPMMVQPPVSCSMSLIGQAPLAAPMSLLGQPPVSAPLVLPGQQGRPVIGQQAVPGPQGIRPPMGIMPPGSLNQTAPVAGDLPPAPARPQPGIQQQPAFHTNIAMGPNGGGTVSSTSHPAPRLPPPSVPPPAVSPATNLMHPASQGSRPPAPAIPSLLSLPTFPTKPYNNGNSGNIQQQPPQEIESYTTSSSSSSQRQYQADYQGQMYVEPTSDPIASAVQAAAFQAHSSRTASPHSSMNGPGGFHRPRTPQGFSKKGKK